MRLNFSLKYRILVCWVARRVNPWQGNKPPTSIPCSFCTVSVNNRFCSFNSSVTVEPIFSMCTLGILLVARLSINLAQFFSSEGGLTVCSSETINKNKIAFYCWLACPFWEKYNFRKNVPIVSEFPDNEFILTVTMMRRLRIWV